MANYSISQTEIFMSESIKRRSGTESSQKLLAANLSEKLIQSMANSPQNVWQNLKNPESEKNESSRPRRMTGQSHFAGNESASLGKAQEPRVKGTGISTAPPQEPPGLTTPSMWPAVLLSVHAAVLGGSSNTGSSGGADPSGTRYFPRASILFLSSHQSNMNTGPHKSVLGQVLLAVVRLLRSMALNKAAAVLWPRRGLGCPYCRTQAA